MKFAINLIFLYNRKGDSMSNSNKTAKEKLIALYGPECFIEEWKDIKNYEGFYQISNYRQSQKFRQNS